MVVMAAADEADLMHMVATCVSIDDRPSAVRFPRGAGTGAELPDEAVPLEIGKGRILREGSKIAILSLGARLQECLKAADELQASGLTTTVADARFAKPLDEELITKLSRSHEVLITIEEGAIGGFGSHVLNFLAKSNLLDTGARVRPMSFPDEFVAHGGPDEQYEDARMMASDIVKEVFAALDDTASAKAKA